MVGGWSIQSQSRTSAASHAHSAFPTDIATAIDTAVLFRDQTGDAVGQRQQPPRPPASANATMATNVRTLAGFGGSYSGTVNAKIDSAGGGSTRWLPGKAGGDGGGVSARLAEAAPVGGGGIPNTRALDVPPQFALQTSTPTRVDAGRQDTTRTIKVDQDAAATYTKSGSRPSVDARVPPRESELAIAAELINAGLWDENDAASMSGAEAVGMFASLQTLFGAIPEDAADDDDTAQNQRLSAVARDVSHVPRASPQTRITASGTTESRDAAELASQLHPTSSALPASTMNRGHVNKDTAPMGSFGLATSEAAKVVRVKPAQSTGQSMGRSTPSTSARATTSSLDIGTSTPTAASVTAAGGSAKTNAQTSVASISSAHNSAGPNATPVRASTSSAVGNTTPTAMPLASTKSASPSDTNAASLALKEAIATAQAAARVQEEQWRSPSSSPSKRRAAALGEDDSQSSWWQSEITEAAAEARIAATRTLPHDVWDDLAKDASPDKLALFRLLRIEASAAARRVEHCTQRAAHPARGGDAERAAAAAALTELATAGSTRGVQWARPAELAPASAPASVTKKRSATPLLDTNMRGAKQEMQASTPTPPRAAVVFERSGIGSESVAHATSRPRAAHMSREQELQLDIQARASLSPLALDAFRTGMRMRRATSAVDRTTANTAPVEVADGAPAVATQKPRRRAAPASYVEPKPQARRMCMSKCCEPRQNGARRARACGSCCTTRTGRVCCSCACVAFVAMEIMFVIFCCVVCWAWMTGLIWEYL